MCWDTFHVIENDLLSEHHHELVKKSKKFIQSHEQQHDVI